MMKVFVVPIMDVRVQNDNTPSSAEVKNAWSFTFTPPYVFMALHLVKLRVLYRYLLGCDTV
jgi:hypothetical protein